MDALAAASVLVGATVAIGALVFVWMRGSRRSQKRFEEQNERIIALLAQIAEQTKRN